MSIDVEFEESSPVIDELGWIKLFKNPGTFVMNCHYFGKVVEIFENSDDEMNLDAVNLGKAYVDKINPDVEFFEKYLAFCVKAAGMMGVDKDKLPADSSEHTLLAKQLFGALFLRKDAITPDEANEIIAFYSYFLGGLRGLLRAGGVNDENIKEFVQDLTTYEKCLLSSNSENASFSLSF